MTLKTSFINTGIIKHNLKRYWWVSALSFVALFMATILRILLSDDHFFDAVIHNPSLFGGILSDDVGIMLLIPSASVLVAVCVFRYMQNPKSATVIHSMPPKRTALFTSTFLSGIILFVVPIMITALILTVLSVATKFGTLFSVVHVMRWLGIFVLYGLSFYSLAMLMGVFTGSSVAQFVFTYIAPALPLGLVALCTALFDSWLYAFIEQTANPIMDTLLDVVPYHYPLAVTNSFQKVETWQYFVIGGYTVFSYIIGILLYRRRKIECSGEIISFKFLKPIFLYGVSVCFALTGAVFIKAITFTRTVSLIALICFGLIGYSAAKMLILKSFKIIKYYKEALVLAGVLIVFWCSITFNLFGFGKSVPDINKIEKAYLGSYMQSNWLYDTPVINYGFGADNAVFTQKENIEAIIKMQKNAIEKIYPQYNPNVPYDPPSSVDYKNFCISYKMKNGRMIAREYTLKSEDAYKLLSTQEAKEYMFPYLLKDAQKIDFLKVISTKSNMQSESVSETDKKEAIIKALCKDIQFLSAEEIFEINDSGIHLEITLKQNETEGDGYAFINLNPNFENTYKFIKENYPGMITENSEDSADTQTSGYFFDDRKE